MFFSVIGGASMSEPRPVDGPPLRRQSPDTPVSASPPPCTYRRPLASLAQPDWRHDLFEGEFGMGVQFLSQTGQDVLLFEHRKGGIFITGHLC